MEDSHGDDADDHGPVPPDGAAGGEGVEVHHKHHPVRDWREFLKEVGIIVLGVLIALGAEQTAEWLHWRHQVHAAEDAIRLEVQTDNGPQAVARVAIEPCLVRQLDALQAAIEAGADRTQIQRLAAAYSPPRRTWDQEAWRAATASQVASHMPAAEMLAWSGPYRTIPGLADSNNKEQHHLVSLLAGRRSAGPATQAEEERWLVAVQNLRHENDSMAYGSLTLLAAARDAGAPVSRETEAKVLAELRAHYGPCVVAPDLSPTDMTSQLNDPRHR